jgi:alpha-tubulin suppressor-like RCC1 family protein
MVPGFNGAVEVSCGALHTCVRLSSGQVRCWGYNGYGQLGDNSVTTNYTPVVVDINTTNSVLTGAVQLTSGIYHTCARISDGTVRCWGYNGYGELGNGTTTAARIATPVQELRPGASSPITLTGVRHVAAGFYQTCAAMTDLTVRCWGRGDYGQIGDGALLSRRHATEVIQLSGGVRCNAVPGAPAPEACGADNNCNGVVGDVAQSLCNTCAPPTATCSVGAGTCLRTGASACADVGVTQVAGSEHRAPAR